MARQQIEHPPGQRIPAQRASGTRGGKHCPPPLSQLLDLADEPTLVLAGARDRVGEPPDPGIELAEAEHGQSGQVAEPVRGETDADWWRGQQL